ncbi:MAG: hypothetical protein ACFFE8_12500, partial [Candidatus Heimdallarchaeota archaeon]
MREKGPKITTRDNKLTITFEEEVDMADYFALVYGFGKLPSDQQAEILDTIRNYRDLGHEVHLPQPVSSSPLQTLQTIKTKKEKILAIVSNWANPTWLNAKEVLDLYEHYIDRDISISTVQTNLNRLVEAGYVERNDTSNPIEYRIH